MTETPDVAVTATAKSKAFRLFPARELREIAQRAWHGDCRVFRKGESDEFHAVVDGYAVVLRPEDGTLVVITQMHAHPDYDGEATYQYVRGIGEVMGRV